MRTASITVLSASAVLIMVLSRRGKHCEDVPGDVTMAERSWIAYTPGETAQFVNGAGATATLTAGNVESRWHDGGGSKGECSKDHESLHQTLTGLDPINGSELAVVHSRETGNAPAYVCGHYMDMTPMNGVTINGATYDEVYITPDSTCWFTKAAGLIKAREWMRVP